MSNLDMGKADLSLCIGIDESLSIQIKKYEEVHDNFKSDMKIGRDKERQRITRMASTTIPGTHSGIENTISKHNLEWKGFTRCRVTVYTDCQSEGEIVFKTTRFVVIEEV